MISVGLHTPRIRRPRFRGRRTFAGELRDSVLRILRGCWSVNADTLEQTHDPRRAVPFNLGDRVLVYPRVGDELAILELTSVEAANWDGQSHRVRLLRGTTFDGPCFCMAVKI